MAGKIMALPNCPGALQRVRWKKRRLCLLLCGDETDHGHRHAGCKIEKTLCKGDVCAAAQNADVRQREEGDEQAVDALRTRQKLKNKDFTEQRGISETTPAAA